VDVAHSDGNAETHIRLAEFDDAEAIAGIIARNFDEVIAKYHSPSVVEKFKSENSVHSVMRQMKWKDVFVAVTNNAIVGTGAFADFGTQNESKYSVSNLYVLPQCHRTGIGKALFECIKDDAAEHNAAQLHVPSTRNAIGFYEKMGFIIDGVQNDIADEITWMTLGLE
jgi:ribosomal protein S18 acetylase RimI-like enzyme